MKPRAIIGMLFLGTATAFLLTSMYYWQLSSMRYLNYLCPTAADGASIRDTYLDLARAFGITGGILGAIGTWITVSGKSESVQKARQ